MRRLFHPIARPLAVFVLFCFVLATTRPALAGSPPVQPVPYKASQPVQYGAAPDSTPAPAPTPAPPPPPRVVTAVGNDVVHLKDGGMIRGTLIEAIPKDHATVQLGTGQNAIIPWHLIDHIEHGAAAHPTTSSPKPDDGGPTPTVRVHIESPDTVTLEALDSNGAWVVACTSPCDRDVPLRAEYRMTASGMRNTKIFEIAANPGEQVIIRLSPASKAAFIGGIVLVSTGPVVSIIGLVVILANAVNECLYSTTATSTTCNSGGSGSTTGTILALGGLGMIAAGIIMVATNARSGVSQDATATHVEQDAWLRRPTWREDPMGASMPRAAGIPLLQGSF